MALDGERELLGAHAEAVIGDLDAVDPAGLDGYRDAGRPGIERVFNEFTGGGGGAFRRGGSLGIAGGERACCRLRARASGLADLEGRNGFWQRWPGWGCGRWCWCGTARRT